MVRPVTTIGLVAPVDDPGTPPLEETHVAECPVIGAPLFDPAVNVTLSALTPPKLALPIAGAVGTFAAVMGAEAADAADVPAELVAVTEQVYVFWAVNDVTTRGLPPPKVEPLTPPSLDVHDAV